MAFHNTTGIEGEELAASWLVEQGFSIIERNLRYGSLEADIIASKNNLLHFIEVKTSTSSYNIYPDDMVGKKKIRNLILIADTYTKINPQWKRIQIDILAITLPLNRSPEYFFVEDVYI